MRLKHFKKIDYDASVLDSFKVSELKKIADYWLRKFLLKNSKRQNNKIFCPIKNQWFAENKIHVAHFFDRGTMCTRYDLDNCHLISEQSNMWDAQVPFVGYKSKHHFEYEVYLREKLGEERFEDLLDRSKQICILKKEDYLEIIKKFKDE